MKKQHTADGITLSQHHLYHGIVEGLGLLDGDSTDILQSVDRSSQAGLGISRGCASACIVPAGGGQEEGGGGDEGEEDGGGWRGWKTCKRFIP